MRNYRFYIPRGKYHGGWWAKGQTYTSGWYPSESIAFVIGNLHYNKIKFIVVTNPIKALLKRVAIFRQSRKNKVGIMNLKLQSLL